MKMKLEKLGNLTKNLDNKRKPLNAQQREKIRGSSSYPYIGANKIMDYVDDYIFDEKILCLAEDGGTWGFNQQCSVIYNGKTWVNNHTHVLVENGNANLEYLKYYLNYASLNKHITGTTRGKLTRRALNIIEIPLPSSLDKQIKIANLLTQIESLIAKREESIALLDELLRSSFLDMFGDPVLNGKGWEVKSLHRVCTKIIGGGTPSKLNPSFYTGNIPWVTAKDMKFEYIVDSIDHITEEAIVKSSANLIPINSLLMVTRSGKYLTKINHQK